MQTDLFLTQAWFELLQQHGLECSPHAVQALDLPSRGGEPVVRLWLQQSRPKGGWASLSNYYTGVFGPQGEVDVSQMEGWVLVARQFRQFSGGGVVSLEPLDASLPWVDAIEDGARRAGYQTWREQAFGNWYQTVEPGRFDMYWAERPSALCHTVERARRRLDKAGPWRVDIVANTASQDAVSFEQACKAYLKVYASSWKPQEPNPAFIPAFMGLAARQGCLRLGVLWRGDEALAAQLWLVYPGQSAQIFKLAHVKGQEKWSAGSVLTADLARHAIDVDGAVELDFLSGDDAYKADWMAFRRERVRLVLAHPASLLGARYLALRALRSLLGKRP